MTTATATRVEDPIARALALAEQRETDKQLLKEQRAAEQAAQREANRIEQARLRQEAELQRIHGLISNMIAGFKKSVADYMIQREWNPEAVIIAGGYVEALIRAKGDEVPKISDSIARIIQKKFVVGIAMYNDVVPEGFFVGQRQEWFAPLYEAVLKEGVRKH